MNFFKYIICLTLSVISFSTIFSQEKMIVKNRSFNPNENTNIVNNILPNNNGYVTDGMNVSSQFPNIRVLPSVFNQTQPSITFSQASNTKIFIGANTDYGMGYYYSQNSGLNWTGNDIMPNSVYYSSNPSVAYDNANRLFYNYNDDYLVVDKSNNFGANWAGRMVVPSTSLFDMNFLTADNNSSSPYIGRVYTAWSNFNLTQPAIYFSYSTNNGTSFTSGVQIGSPTANHYEQGVKIAVAPNGDVYCIWATPNVANSNVEDKIAFVKSTNGGVSFSAPVYPLTINGVRGYLPPTGIRVNSFPSMTVDNVTGAIYICWSQKNLSPAGSDADIVFCSSTNGGSSFSTPVRVNDDALNNGKNQVLPWITVDNSNRKISIAFFDNRDTYYADSMDVYLAVSTNSGSNFTNIKITDHAFRPAPLSGYSDGYYSDYIGVAANNNTVRPVWADSRNGVVQIYTANVELIPYIIHQPLKDNENVSGSNAVLAEIKTFGTVLNASETKLFYGVGGITDSVVMTNSGGNNWTANINGNGSASTFYYYIKATDANGGFSLLPTNAPTNLFSFKTGTDNIKPTINHSPITYSNRTIFPDTLKAFVWDNRGLDSVWVKWYRNNTSTGIKTFRLNNITGDFFKGVFNSTASQLTPNDSIYYRIFAQDNSSQHNSDSTQLYKFTVYSSAEIQLGFGNLTASYPFRTFSMDARTDMLFLASEISPLWGNAQGRITGIGFNVLNASPQVMTDLTIKIEHTTANTLTGFSNSGWTTFWNGTMALQGTGWQYFNYQTPFIWDGINNIIIEVCYNNTSVNMNSAVEATTKAGMTWHQYADLTNGSGCNDLNAGATQNNRPNIKLILNSVLSVNETGNTIPDKFSLSQNYPNPFNPTTKISFQLPVAGFSSLKIFDILGREMKTLVNEFKQAGYYNVDFNASDFPSGVYFYQLSVDNEKIAIKKMLYIK